MKTDRWNQMESSQQNQVEEPDVNSYAFGHQIFHTNAKITKWKTSSTKGVGSYVLFNVISFLFGKENNLIITFTLSPSFFQILLNIPLEIFQINILIFDLLFLYE